MAALGVLQDQIADVIDHGVVQDPLLTTLLALQLALLSRLLLLLT